MSVNVFYRGVQIAPDTADDAWLRFYGRMHGQRHLQERDPERLQWLQNHVGEYLTWHVEVIDNPPPVAGVMRSPNAGPEVLLRAYIVFDDPRTAMLYRLAWQ